MDVLISLYDRSHNVFWKNRVTCAKPIIVEVFRQMRADPNYSLKYESLLEQLTLDGDSAPVAVNVLFAGDPTKADWKYGLWAHHHTFKSSAWEGQAYYTVNGTTRNIMHYQISPITSKPCIATICHESGHMVCGFPDLYSYDENDPGGGVGYFSLMHGSSGNNWNPQGIDPYLRAAAGWVPPRELGSTPGERTVTCDSSDVWKWSNPSNPKEYFLIENRRRKGRDATLPCAKWENGARSGLVLRGGAAVGDTMTFQVGKAETDFTLTVDPNGGLLAGSNFGDREGTSLEASVTVTYGTQLYWTLGTATPAGCEFDGWWTSPTGGDQVYNNEGKAIPGTSYWDDNYRWQYEGDLNIYAHWKGVKNPLITGIAVVPDVAEGVCVVCFEGLGGVEYELQWVASLDGEWKTVKKMVAADGAEVEVQVEVPDGDKGFLRVLDESGGNEGE